MKSGPLIIITMIFVIILSIVVTYSHYQMNLCDVSHMSYNTPKMNNVFECVQFLSEPDPFAPHGEPTILYDIQFEHLVFFEIILIIGSGFSLIIFLALRKRK